MIIDTHAHINIFSAEQRKLTGHKNVDQWIDYKLDEFKESRVFEGLDKIQNLLNFHDNRFLPRSYNKLLESAMKTAVTTRLPLFARLNEVDLLKNMKTLGISRSLVVAFDKQQAALDIGKICHNFSDLDFASTISGTVDSIESKFDQFISLGLKAIYFHPVLDERDPSCEEYKFLLEKARAHDLPVILRTGTSAVPQQEKLDMCEVNNYREMVATNRDIQFIFSHSNLANYEIAIQMCEVYENVMLDSAWQSAEAMDSIIKTLGSDRLMFASDWPMMGDQQKVQIRIFNKLKMGTEIAEKVFFRNAQKIFKLT